jgi:hypothetical protein
VRRKRGGACYTPSPVPLREDLLAKHKRVCGDFKLIARINEGNAYVARCTQCGAETMFSFSALRAADFNIKCSPCYQIAQRGFEYIEALPDLEDASLKRRGPFKRRMIAA